jgi:hypothetical protein
MISITENGLYCASGDFYIDPWRPVPRAVLTHAHGDHARPGSALYFAAVSGCGVLRHRLGAETRLEPKAYREPFVLRFGPMRSVKPELVFEIAFEGIFADSFAWHPPDRITPAWPVIRALRANASHRTSVGRSPSLL